MRLPCCRTLQKNTGARWLSLRRNRAASELRDCRGQPIRRAARSHCCSCRCEDGGAGDGLKLNASRYTLQRSPAESPARTAGRSSFILTTMTKQQLIERVANDTGQRRGDVEDIYEAIFQGMSGALAAGRRIEVR